MTYNIKYVHTNIITKDWKKLARFYIEVFDCKPVYPERNLSGDWIDKLTGVPNADIKGIHLRLPGYEGGPTLEIFEYSKISPNINTQKINTPGFAHIAFHVDDVESVLKKLIENGGAKYGELVEKNLGEQGILKVIYAKDIDGNIIEIQNWEK